MKNFFKILLIILGLAFAALAISPFFKIIELAGGLRAIIICGAILISGLVLASFIQNEKLKTFAIGFVISLFFASILYFVLENLFSNILSGGDLIAVSAIASLSIWLSTYIGRSRALAKLIPPLLFFAAIACICIAFT